MAVVRSRAARHEGLSQDWSSTPLDPPLLGEREKELGDTPKPSAGTNPLYPLGISDLELGRTLKGLPLHTLAGRRNPLSLLTGEGWSEDEVTPPVPPAGTGPCPSNMIPAQAGIQNRRRSLLQVRVRIPPSQTPSMDFCLHPFQTASFKGI